MADSANSGMRDRSRTRSNSSRGIQSHGHGSSDHDARHKVASLTAQLIQKEHRIRGLEQGVQTKLAEVCLCVFLLCVFVSIGGAYWLTNEKTLLLVRLKTGNASKRHDLGPHEGVGVSVLTLLTG